MHIVRRCGRPVSLGLWAFLLLHAPWSLRAGDAPGLTIDQKEEFLRSAKIIAETPAKKGVTDTRRVTLSDGKITHDANVQRVDEHKDFFEGEDGTKELNFKDTYKFNVAAWKLARLLGIDDMMPPYVERKYAGQAASFSWYVDNDKMDEAERLKKKLTAPNAEQWNQEMYVVRVFDQLIFNIDRNPGNLRIDTSWHIWMIDHSRSFRTRHDLRAPQNLVQCDRTLLVKMKGLDQASLEKELMPYLNKEEIKGLLARRDRIVRLFEEKGESALYDRPPRF
ncbi:MAG: hypothetical protein LAP40_17375 [Acidobacteriia bacterium]|nr:hypothetical protein [Terriglobia bacterium]